MMTGGLCKTSGGCLRLLLLMLLLLLLVLLQLMSCCVTCPFWFVQRSEPPERPIVNTVSETNS